MNKAPIQVYVGGIGLNTSVRDIQELFAEFGPVEEVIPKGRYAFVEFRNYEDAQRAIKHKHGSTWNGRQLTVEEPSKSNFSDISYF